MRPCWWIRVPPSDLLCQSPDGVLLVGGRAVVRPLRGKQEARHEALAEAGVQDGHAVGRGRGRELEPVVHVEENGEGGSRGGGDDALEGVPLCDGGDPRELTGRRYRTRPVTAPLTFLSRLSPLLSGSWGATSAQVTTTACVGLTAGSSGNARLMCSAARPSTPGRASWRKKTLPPASLVSRSPCSAATMPTGDGIRPR